MKMFFKSIIIGFISLFFFGCVTDDLDNYFSYSKEFNKTYVERNPMGWNEINLKMKLNPDSYSSYGNVYFTVSVDMNPIDPNLDLDEDDIDTIVREWKDFWSKWDDDKGLFRLDLFDREGFKIESVLLPRNLISFDFESDPIRIEIKKEEPIFEISEFRSITDFDVVPVYYISD